MRRMDRRALCVLCRRHPIDARWRPFCSPRCREEDLARWADGSYRIAGPPEISVAGTDPSPIEVTTGQLDLEWQHLRAKIAARSPERLEAADALVAGPAGAAREHPPAHPLFTVVPVGPRLTALAVCRL